MAPRRPTQPEWGDLCSCFPGLIKDNVWITDDPTPVYNCIAFSLLYFDRWINPPQPPVGPFQQLYNSYAHSTLPVGGDRAYIDGWATPPSGPLTAMTHGSRVTTSSKVSSSGTGLWESKLGQSYRITHGRSELTGNLYGRIVTSFS